MSAITGIYKQFTFADLEEYGAVNKLFYKLLKDVYSENNMRVPMDMLASIMDIMSYDRFIKTYVNKNEAYDLEYGVAEKLMSLEILDCDKFSNNMLEQMVTYNIVPYQITDYEMIFITPETDPHNIKKQEFVLFRRSIANVLDASDKAERIKRCSNKLFSDALCLIRKKTFVTEDDIKLTDEQRLNKIFIDAIVNQASDIYIDTKSDGIDISFGIFNDRKHYRRYRMNKTRRKQMIDAVFSVGGIAPNTVVWTGEGSKDMHIKNLGDVENGRYEGRVNMVNTVNDPSPVIRVHDTRRTANTLDSLPLNDQPVSELKKIISNRSGIVVVAGAKGQGKSTTIYACLDTIAKTRPNARIEEMSNPVEVKLDTISQLSINSDLDVDYEELKRASSRRNATVNFIGEINDDKTTDFVVNVAGQECLVLTTIHAESASMVPMKVQGFTMDRPGLYPIFIELLKGIVHQVMLKRACPDCTEKIPVDELKPEYKDILEGFGYQEKFILVEKRDKSEYNCPTCGNLGFLIDKPVVCLDVLMVNEDLRDKIRENLANPRIVIEQEGKKLGNTGLHDALRYLSRDVVTFDMIYRGYQLQNMRVQDRIAHRKA